MKTQTFTVTIYKEEDMYIAECLDIGTIDQGATVEEAINNLRTATQLYLEECPDVQAIPRLVTTMEVSYRELICA